MSPERARTSALAGRVLPVTMLPLALAACGLASAPWLRAYPSSVLAAPLFGAAVLAVLLPFVVVNVGVRKLWQTALIDLVGYLFFVTLVALRRPLGYADLWSGLVHGPSQILTYALPLSSPRTLLVVPVTLCWLCGSIVGECVGRGWRTVLPYFTVLITFGLAYAGTARAVTNAVTGRRVDTLLAGLLLLSLLLLRAVQAAIDQDAGTAAAGAAPGLADPRLPLRGVATGLAAAVLVAAGSALVVQTNAFAGRSEAPERQPPIDASAPQTPLSFIAGVRPADPKDRGQPVFAMTVPTVASRYVSLGDVDTYNGDTWSFTRTFRPSGGVVPPDSDPALRPAGPPVSQQYTITGDILTGAPWMPFEFRPERVLAIGIDADAASGMVVPSSGLREGQRYSVVSSVALRSFDQLRSTALPGTSYQSIDLQLPPSVANSLAPVISAFAKETGTPPAPAVPFLQAVAADLRAHYGLVGASGPTATPGSRPTRFRQSAPTAAAPPSPSPGQSAGARTGGTSFAAVLASILGSARTATPEQYATLVALIARQLNLPARVVTGFRIPTRDGAPTITPGTYTVTTGEAWTWVEVPIQGQGWVVLDPSPGRGSGRPNPQNAGPSKSPAPTSSAPPNLLITRAGHGGSQAQGPKGVVPAPRPFPVALVVGIAAGTLSVLAVVVLLLPLLRKWVRVRRRRAGSPRHRVVGAWQETIDVLAEAGLPDPTALTSAEVATATTATFGAEPGEQARSLGAAANRAIFDPGAPIESTEADAAWNAHVALRRAVRARLRVAQRIRSGLRFHRSRSTPVSGPETWRAAAPAGGTARRTRRPAAGRGRRRVH